MSISREEHCKFLDRELKSQTDAYVKLIQQSAISLIEKEEIFTCQFLKFDKGEMILKFKSDKSIPRKGEYLTAVLLIDKMRSYKSWGNISWANLRSKYQKAFTEVVCIWHQKSHDEGYLIAGFKGVEIEFANKLVEKCLITLGPKEPPLEYIQNLIQIVRKNRSDEASRFLDFDITNQEWIPTLLDERKNLADFVHTQLQISDEVIIQGPPGTGKTFLMSEFVDILLRQNKSVLVTSLTNRALIEIASKPSLKFALENEKVYKCNLTKDEVEIVPNLLNSKDIVCMEGVVSLATFFMSSGFAKNIEEHQPFDYVIVDEASQALLAMFAASRVLGKKTIFIGDPSQLQPIVTLDFENIEDAIYLVEGFNTICKNLTIASFQLTETHRLTKRGAKYTSLFYKGNLKSIASPLRLQFPELGPNLNKYLHNEGGPVLIKSKFPVGIDNPEFGIYLIIDLVQNIIKVLDKPIEIAILSKTKKAVKTIQKSISNSIGSDKNITIETVERVQGLTCDITIFLIPNSKLNYSLTRTFFNVATSRAKRHTIIIADESVTSYPLTDHLVKSYLDKLNSEHSFFIDPIKSSRMLKN